MRIRDILPFFTFVTGAAAGAYTTWRCLKGVYEEKTKVEAESLRKVMASLSEQSKQEAKTEEKKEEDQRPVSEFVKTSDDLISYAKIIKEKSYTPDIPEILKHDGPYVISPEEYEEPYDYNKVSIIYFADGALSDNEYDILTNNEVNESFGFECLTHFGEYEPDMVYVRNDAKRCDYAIQKDLRNYSELGIYTD